MLAFVLILCSCSVFLFHSEDFPNRLQHQVGGDGRLFRSACFLVLVLRSCSKFAFCLKDSQNRLLRQVGEDELHSHLSMFLFCVLFPFPRTHTTGCYIKLMEIGSVFCRQLEPVLSSLFKCFLNPQFQFIS